MPAPAPAARDLSPGDLHLWLIALYGSDLELAQAEAVLSADELSRARRFHFERDARRYVLAHAALRRILAGYLAVSPPALRFEVNAYGKPSLASGAAPGDAGLTFNLSHSGELALLGVAAGRPVGVDIELVRPELATRQIAERFFSPAEVLALAALTTADWVHAFFRCWTRKEAFVKARGEGLSLPLDSFDVTLRPGEPPALLRVGAGPAAAQAWTIVSPSVDLDDKHHVAAVTVGAVAGVYTWLYQRNR